MTSHIYVCDFWDDYAELHGIYLLDHQYVEQQRRSKSITVALLRTIQYNLVHKGCRCCAPFSMVYIYIEQN